ncbi:M64 family metallopeptidase [Streptomyces chengbuensis]|uniref:M64 family metallopeptidase n=1 Tax=Streptomyces chengbuensis TaxID=3053466 RepID=UPI0025B3B031|nr:M64 family metallopeptidase [Streptomyces sp. HUAS CB01]WJY54266.1 M64 family metallopeptidase [Streptomyces sp. HUAS CB01]
MRSAWRRVIATAGTAAVLTGVLTAPAAADPAVPTGPGVEVEVPGPEDGDAAGSGHARVPRDGRDRPAPRLSAAEKSADGAVTKLLDNGTTGDRLDIVVVGDGYTAGELDRFHADAKEMWAELAGVEPYTTYQGLFNVWTVDAVSNQSGVSGDPGPDVVRDTALGSYFWCDDIERLLCVDQSKVDGYVAKAPEADLVVVLANSAKYGGAGYNEPSGTLGYEGISTASAGNEKSGQVAIHETGHSLGKLADEYFYPDYPGFEEYTGPEPADSNVSVLTAGDMAAQRAKWHRWLGEESPDGGAVGTYEGGGYFVKGLYRPTDDSLMRSLDKPFNLPGVESMIAGFHRHARLVTAVTPTERLLRLRDTARVSLPRITDPDGRRLTVRWYLDGRELKSLAGRTRVRVSDLALFLLDLRTHKLSVTVENRTRAVRDPEIAEQMTSTVGWNVRL